MSKLRDIVALLDKGFVLYDGPVPESFYAERGCNTPKKAQWLMRPWAEGRPVTNYICVGCSRACAVVDPVGWQILLPVYVSRPSAVVYGPMKPLTVDELLRSKRVLRADEAAWALNLGLKVIYDYIQDGRLDTIPGRPVRVTVESVRRCLEPIVP